MCALRGGGGSHCQCYVLIDCQLGQCVVVSGTHLGLMTKLLLLGVMPLLEWVPDVTFL
jgi:hypothetical protein